MQFDLGLLGFTPSDTRERGILGNPVFSRDKTEFFVTSCPGFTRADFAPKRKAVGSNPAGNVVAH